MSVVNADFNEIVKTIRRAFVELGQPVDTGEWQAKRNVPQAQTVELEDVSFHWPIPASVPALVEAVHPSLGWAEEHFAERISGIPYNPPPSHVRWPYAVASNADHQQDARFSHTYPERLWPKTLRAQGIRYPLGDLSDVVTLLRERPLTRQAYVPIWYPEDTGAVDGQRVPCTLGYHFMRRGNDLKCVYFIRSCDYFRHFRDDVYLAARLTQWLCSQVSDDLQPGNLVMHISSLHVFATDMRRLQHAVALET
jgi:thymidylate synthase